MLFPSPAVRRAASIADDVLVTQFAWAATAGVVLALLFMASTWFLAAVVAGLGALTLLKLHAQNEIARDFRVPLAAASAAVFDALDETGFGDGTPSRRGVTEREISGRSARVRVEQHPDAVTRVRIRVGLFASDDNRRRAALLLERVEHHLTHEVETAEVL